MLGLWHSHRVLEQQRSCASLTATGHGRSSPLALRHRVHVQVPTARPTRLAAAPGNMNPGTTAPQPMPMQQPIHQAKISSSRLNALFPPLSRPLCSNEKAARAMPHLTVNAARCSQHSALQALALGAASLLGLTVVPATHLTLVPPCPRPP
jgi:hypothetical protein